MGKRLRPEGGGSVFTAGRSGRIAGSARSTAVLASLVILASLLAISPASAAKTVKDYTVDITSPSPAQAASGEPTTFTIKVTNSLATTNVDLGSVWLTFNTAQFSSPTVGTVAAPAGKNWTAQVVTCNSPSVGSTCVQLDPVGGTDKLHPTESVSFDLTTTPSCGASGDYPLFSGQIAWPSIGPGISTFRLSGSLPIVSVTSGDSAPTKLSIIGVTDSGGAPLDASDQAYFDTGSQTLFIKFDTSVNVVVQARTSSDLPATVCSPIEVTLRKGSASGTSLGTGTIAAGADPPNVAIALTAGLSAENFQLFATATGLTEDSISVSVQSTVVVQQGGTGLSCISTGPACGGSPTSSTLASTSGTTADRCDATTESPTCVTVLLPDGTGTGVAFLSLGSCDGVIMDCHTLLITFLANLKAPGAIYGPDSPFTMIVQCDKTTCPGKGVTSYTFALDATNTGNFVDLPACVSNNHTVIDPSLGNVDGCTDYVESNRDGAGDLNLVVRLALDLRGMTK
jgi:hypothetical protein